MSKDPAFLFYSSDFLTGTMFFTDEQVGKYMRLLCAQHQNGSLTEEEMLNICGDRDEKIFKKFQKGNDGKFQNQRLTDEVNKRKKYSASRSKNIGKRWNKDGKPLSGKKIDNIHMKNICNTHVIHMENENEIENKDKDKKKVLKTWRTDFEIYKKMVHSAYLEIICDPVEMEKQQKYHSKLDIKMSLEMSIDNYWGTVEGWKQKKKSRGAEIDMKRTLIRNIDKNRAWKNDTSSGWVPPEMREK